MKEAGNTEEERAARKEEKQIDRSEIAQKSSSDFLGFPEDLSSFSCMSGIMITLLLQLLPYHKLSWP